MATFTPLPWQVAPWNDISPVVVISIGAGTGKSWLYLWKMVLWLTRDTTSKIKRS